MSIRRKVVFVLPSIYQEKDLSWRKFQNNDSNLVQVPESIFLAVDGMLSSTDVRLVEDFKENSHNVEYSIKYRIWTKLFDKKVYFYLGCCKILFLKNKKFKRSFAKIFTYIFSNKPERRVIHLWHNCSSNLKNLRRFGNSKLLNYNSYSGR